MSNPKKLFGWITPKRDFIACPAYGHIEKALELRDSHTELALALAGIQQRIDDIDEVKQECTQHEEDEGSSNAEWHIYEIARRDLFDSVQTRLLIAGFIRVGTASDNRVCCFEGRPRALRQHREFTPHVRVVFSDLDMRCEFEPQKHQP